MQSEICTVIQVTVGGYNEDGVDACNEVTLMCLKACRRLPLNAPCVSLRLTNFTPAEVKKEAAMALLSGGAHPILFHDEKMVQGPLKSQSCKARSGHSCNVVLQDSMKCSVNPSFALVYQNQRI